MSVLLKTIMRGALAVSLLLSAVILVHLNLGLCYAPSYTEQGLDKGLLGSLRFLRSAIREKAPEKMQSVYPEGYFFMHAMYGLSWCEVAARLPKSDPLFHEAMSQVNAADSALRSGKGKSIFEKELPVPYGVFYTGWSTYLLGKKIGLTGGARADSTDLERFVQSCADIATQFLGDKTIYPESYRGACWPSDAVVGMACLSLYDRTLDTNLYENIIRSWMKRVRAKLDVNGMVPHSVIAGTDEVKENARGSSSSLMLCFWSEIDTAFAREQFKRYKEKFLDERFGLPGIREYPKGTQGNGDVDSGPVLLGIGGSASVVGLRAMTLYGENDIAIGLRNSIEVFGSSHSSGAEKYYLFGQLPMADAFIAWANSAGCSKANAPVAKTFWSWRFRVYSLLILLVCSFLMTRISK